MDQEVYEQIERYLSGGMEAEERRAFEADMQRDTALADAVSLQSALRRSLGNPARRQLLDALDDVVRNEPVVVSRPALRLLTPARIAVAASLLLLISAGLWWWSRRPELPAPVAQTPVPAVPAPTVPQQPPVLPVDSPAPEKRLALADPAAFRPSPALDPLAGTQLRGAGHVPLVQQPQNDANFNLKDGVFTFTMQGKANGQAAMNLQIFNNRERDFIAGKTVFHSELSIRQDAFLLKKALRLSPGRYYAVLTAAGEEEPLAVVRFFVEKPVTPIK